jgi:hypothetical protein
MAAAFLPDLPTGRSWRAGHPQKSNRFLTNFVDQDCTKQTWPSFSAACLHGNGAKLEPRFVCADRD